MNRIEKLKEFLQITPNDSFLLHALALEYIKAGNDGEAGKCFAAVLENDPEYVGSYYHYAKLLERKNEKEAAISIYEKGIAVAKAVNNRHALSELQAAYDELVY